MNTILLLFSMLFCALSTAYSIIAVFKQNTFKHHLERHNSNDVSLETTTVTRSGLRNRDHRYKLKTDTVSYLDVITRELTKQ